MTARYAIYAAPPPGSQLAAFTASWLGRDAVQDVDLPQPAVPGLPAERLSVLTAEPRRYGFHATLKPPFRLADGYSADALDAAVATFAKGRAPVALPALKLDRLGHFLALVPALRSDAVQTLAADCVMAFDAFRAPAPPAEVSRRRASGLTPAQDEYLLRWGYPYVLDEFRLHYTLTGRVTDEAEATLLERHLATVTAPLTHGATIDALCLFVQITPDAPFRVLRRYALTG